MRAGETSREVALATAAARQVIERLQGTQFDLVWARFNRTAADDPGGFVSPGAAFAVPGLEPRADDLDGFVGEILFPDLEVGGELQLREDVVNAALGMPRDLNGDTLIDGNNHRNDYRILPVIVRVRWRGQSGQGQVEFKTIVGNF